jgi:anaerobic dimethyl sulfoxide reductase subunit B (iron-sulfur subunit)
MSRRLGFRVDLRFCTGCKACQIACKDKHHLGPGIRWRRVVETSGGDWERRGEAWVDRSVSYFMSVACMHCELPICAEVCPTGAMAKGEDGIVAVDPGRCMGCRYCEWACPYGAPQLDAAAGVMTKCDLCRDRLAEGRDPACAAACPMRVLGVVDVAAGCEGTDEVFPLPPAALTEPSAAITPHRDVARAEAGDPAIGNAEEI